MKKVRKPLGEPRDELTGSVEYLLLFDAVRPEDLPLAYLVCASYYFARDFQPLFKREPKLFPELPPGSVQDSALEKLTEDFRHAIAGLDAGYLERIAKMVKILKSRVGKFGEIATETFLTTQFARTLLTGDPSSIDVRKVTREILDNLSDADRKEIRTAINRRRLKPDRVRERLGIDTPSKRGRPE